MTLVNETKRVLLLKTDGEFKDSGPDGLGAIESLERLGRIFVLCLAD
jgi:hypothetical protein